MRMAGDKKMLELCKTRGKLFFLTHTLMPRLWRS